MMAACQPFLSGAISKTVNMPNEATVDEIVVTAAAVQAVQVAVGPSSTFNFDDIQNAPSFDRDIKDVVRIDPRVYINEADADNVQCLGTGGFCTEETRSWEEGFSKVGYPPAGCDSMDPGRQVLRT